MSYEGHLQCICKNGHRFDEDANFNYGGYLQGDEAIPKCYCCGERAVYHNSVDDTNCDSIGIIPDSEWEKLKIAPVKTETCPTCNHTKRVEEARYRVPTKEEHRAMRYYDDGFNNLKPYGITKWNKDKPGYGGWWAENSES